MRTAEIKIKIDYSDDNMKYILQKQLYKCLKNIQKDYDFDDVEIKEIDLDTLNLTLLDIIQLED
jgi:hypothetical protein